MGQACKFEPKPQKEQDLFSIGTVPNDFPMGQASGQVNAAVLLRQRAAKMPHAIVRDRVLMPDGRVETEREFHYLSCRRCDLERQADFIEGRQ